jgi:signal transduction histidine kinase
MSASGSLRFRLFATALLAIVVALGIAAFALTGIFEKQVQSRMRSELGNHMLQLISKIDLQAQGTSLLTDDVLADPRFDKPFSGLYWTIVPDKGDAIDSRSLWDKSLADLPTNSAPGRPAYFEAPGPDGQQLYIMQETIIAQTRNGDRKLVINIGVDHEELDTAVAGFRRDLLSYLGIIAGLLLLATWLQVRIGLKPLNAVRDQINAIRTGKLARLEGELPSEVQPLADEINDLLDTQADSLQKARARAGDLAHNLRTPLTVMGSLASDLERSGKPQLSEVLRDQTELMRRSVERELARARMASGRANAVHPPHAAIQRMVKAMQRMPRGNEIDWQLAELPETAVAMDGDDLLELFGNLLDNARKWCKSTVRITGRQDATHLHVLIEDDGPGVAEEQLASIGARGKRLDETAQGAGLGLSIVEDLVSAYGLQMTFDRSELGGLAVRLGFPLPRALPRKADSARTAGSLAGQTGAPQPPPLPDKALK